MLQFTKSIGHSICTNKSKERVICLCLKVSGYCLFLPVPGQCSSKKALVLKFWEARSLSLSRSYGNDGLANKALIIDILTIVR